MGLLRRFSAGLVVCSIAPAAFGANVGFQGFLSQGPAAAALETKIGDFLLTKSVQDFGYSIYQQGRNYGSGSTPESVSQTPALDFVSKHTNGYCSTNISAEVNGLGCKQQNGVAAADAKYLEMGDINFSTIAEPLTYTPLTDLTAQNLIRNIVNPFPDPKYANYVTSPGFKDDGTKKQEYATYMAGQAILGVALYSLNEIYGMRVPGTTLGAGAAAGGSSLMSLMQTQSTTRFEKPDFGNYLADPTTTDGMVLRELAAMEAFRLWMDYQRYMQSERIEALLAAGLAKMVSDGYKQDDMINASKVSPNIGGFGG